MKNVMLLSKNRFSSVKITDIAIKKVPFIKYKGEDDNVNRLLQTISKQVLAISKQQNNHKEVSITLNLADMNLDNCGICLGKKHSVDVLSDTMSYHLIHSAQKCAIVVTHNHPSTQTFSLDDIKFFLSYASIKMFVVVSNQGKVHYMKKTQNYDYDLAYHYLQGCAKKKKLIETWKDDYYKSLHFLKNCSKVGIYYK